MMAGRPWTTADDAMLRALAAKQLRVPEIARRMERNRSLIRAHLIALDLLDLVEKCNAPWTAKDDALLRSIFADQTNSACAKRLGRTRPSIERRAQLLELSKSAEYLQSPAACRLRRGDNVGAAFRFKPGQVPPNKGLRRPGWSAGRMAETQFKKGQRGNKFVPIGSHRVNGDGYLDRKIAATGKTNVDWRAVHRLLWEAAHGPVPATHAVCFKAGRKSTVLEEITLDALELVSRVDLMRRNSYHTNYPKEIGQLIQLRGAVVRQINKRTRANEKQD
jgi:hypothetical protein